MNELTPEKNALAELIARIFVDSVFRGEIFNSVGNCAADSGLALEANNKSLTVKSSS